MIARCYGSDGKCPFAHDVEMRNSLGTDTKEDRRRRIESIVSAKMNLQGDGTTVHLEKIKKDGTQGNESGSSKSRKKIDTAAEDIWTSKEHVEADLEAIRYESYLGEMNNETTQGEDVLRKDVVKILKLMSEKRK